MHRDNKVIPKLGLMSLPDVTQARAIIIPVSRHRPASTLITERDRWRKHIQYVLLRVVNLDALNLRLDPPRSVECATMCALAQCHSSYLFRPARCPVTRSLRGAPVDAECPVGVKAMKTALRDGNSASSGKECRFPRLEHIDFEKHDIQSKK